jgi:transcriptional regulator with XRE-family HTH domain
VSSTNTRPEDRLKQLREERNWTYQEVAHRSEGAFTGSQVSNIEKGLSSWHGASLTTLKGLARAYDMSLENLIAFVENHRPHQDPNDKLSELYKYVPTYHLTASPSKGVIKKVADEQALLPDNRYLYELYKIFQNSEKEPRSRFVVRKAAKGIKAGHTIICETPDWGATVAFVRAIKGKEYSLDDKILGRSDIYKEKEIRVHGILRAELRLFEEPE